MPRATQPANPNQVQTGVCADCVPVLCQRQACLRWRRCRHASHMSNLNGDVFWIYKAICNSINIWCLYKPRNTTLLGAEYFPWVEADLCFAKDVICEKCLPKWHSFVHWVVSRSLNSHQIQALWSWPPTQCVPVPVCICMFQQKSKGSKALWRQ